MQDLNEYKNQILSYWFSDRVKPLWYAKDDNFDEEIRAKFLDVYQLALLSTDYNNIEDIELILALIILFDQFPRNMFRGEAQAFASDSMALALSKYSIDKVLDKNISDKDHLQFLYMPLMHSENLEDQKLSLEKFYNVNENSYKFAVIHKDVISRFGRFPGRNKALGRKSTEEELKFLKDFSYF